MSAPVPAAGESAALANSRLGVPAEPRTSAPLIASLTQSYQRIGLGAELTAEPERLPQLADPAEPAGAGP